MRRQRLAVIALALALVGLGASLASLIDQVRGDPTFCALEGCATVRTSAWASPLGIPLPLFGLGAFGALVALAFVARPRLRRGLALASGAAALGLVVVQGVVLHAWCALCLVADGAAIAHALVVLAGATTIRYAPRRLVACVPAVAGVVFVLAALTHAKPAATTSIVAPVARTHADRVTIVEYVDFECPWCRRMHATLGAAIASAGHAVELVRKMVPLSIHPHARAAAIAWCCADAQGRGDAMADALFAADPVELTPEGCEAIAARVGCDVALYRRTLAQAESRVTADLGEARAAGVGSLPTLHVGDARIVGAASSVDDLARAIDRAATLEYH